MILIVASLLLISLFADGNAQGIGFYGRKYRTLQEITRIFHSVNPNLRHHPNVEVEATRYPKCIHHNRELIKEHGRGDIGYYIVMTSSKYKSEDYETIAMKWKNNTSFLEEIESSSIFGCAFNESCVSGKDILSCAFDNPLPPPTYPPAPIPITDYIPPEPSRPKPYALTKEMFQEILEQLKVFLPYIRYDNEYFMDLGSAAYWTCPFPNQGSNTHYILGNGRVELAKTDHFGVIVELGRGVPYHDGRMRQAMINFARNWRNKLNGAGPIKFGCSVDPDCYGDMILLCAFYPIDFRDWIPGPQPLPRPSQAQKYTDSMNAEATRLFNLIISRDLEDECLIITRCEEPTPHQGFNKTYSGRLGKAIEILTGTTPISEINGAISTILDRFKNRRYFHSYHFGCCYIPRCQNAVVSNCLFAQ